MGEPARASVTWAEYEKLPDDGNRYEVLEGTLVMVPAPALAHQRVSWRLCALLDRWQVQSGAGGLFTAAPTDVEFARSIVQPDILYVRPDRVAQVAGSHIVGAPDLAVEIFNRAGAARDSITKLQIYARYGVPEYWLVDLESRSVMMLALVDGLYTTFAEGAEDTLLSSRVLPGFTLRPGDLFGEP
jgi:Uma2 family endonuclease